MDFVPDQGMHAVLAGEARDQVGLVLRNPCRQIRSDADVQRAVALARQEIDAGNPFPPATLPCRGFFVDVPSMAGCRGRFNDKTLGPGVRRDDGESRGLPVSRNFRAEDSGPPGSL